MQIKKIEFSDSNSKVIIMADTGAYTITKEELENLLVDLGQMCPDCHDEGEVTVNEAVYPGEPHVAPIGTRKCHCQIKEPEYEHD